MTKNESRDITILLQAWSKGDRSALDELSSAGPLGTGADRVVDGVVCAFGPSIQHLEDDQVDHDDEDAHYGDERLAHQHRPTA